VRRYDRAVVICFDGFVRPRPLSSSYVTRAQKDRPNERSGHGNYGYRDNNARAFDVTDADTGPPHEFFYYKSYDSDSNVTFSDVKFVRLGFFLKLHRPISCKYE